MRFSKQYRFYLSVLLALCLLAGLPFMAVAAERDAIDEVRELLKTEYVDEVPADVLNAPTIKDILTKLGDKHTEYMTQAEYEIFLGSLDRAFSGIGIELEMVSEGILVMKVMTGYGADKAGIQAGDIITEAAGTPLAGRDAEFCVSLLRGPEGTSVALKVRRDTQTLSLAVERSVIEQPLVDSRIIGDYTGYIAIYSFGADTVAQFAAHVQALKDKGADSWIIDLRDNGGGYTQGALDILGYITGEKPAVLLRSKSALSTVHNATKQDFTLDGPVILLTNRYTGSSSEIMTASVKDHRKATIIGETTYGSGRVKSLIPLTNGGYLKMTVYRFFSPYNQPIDEVGIAPHLELAGADELEAALLLLKHHNQDVARNDSGDKSGYIKLSTGPNHFVLAAEDLRSEANWAAGRKILDSADAATALKLGTSAGWDALPEAWLKERHKIYYPGYVEAGSLPDIPLNKVFTVTFKRAMDWQSVTPDSIELIDAATGRRLKTSLAFADSTCLTVTPQAELNADSEYWLVIHPEIKDAAGRFITGGTAVARTLKP